MVAIESEVRKGPCTFVQARVEDTDGSGMKLEHTLEFSEEDFRSLHGAQPALKAFGRESKTESEEDDGCCICIGWFPSYIGSWFTDFLPKERNLTFACDGAAPPATIPPARIYTETELPVSENNTTPYPARTLLLLI